MPHCVCHVIRIMRLGFYEQCEIKKIIIYLHNCVNCRPVEVVRNQSCGIKCGGISLFCVFVC